MRRETDRRRRHATNSPHRHPHFQLRCSAFLPGDLSAIERAEQHEKLKGGTHDQEASLADTSNLTLMFQMSAIDVSCDHYASCFDGWNPSSILLLYGNWTAKEHTNAMDMWANPGEVRT